MQGQEVRGQADPGPVLMSHSVAGPRISKMWLTCRGTGRHSSMLGNRDKLQNSAHSRKREKELKGRVLDTRTHAHSGTHTGRAGMTHEPQAKSNMFSTGRREQAEGDEGRSRRGAESGTSIIKLQKKWKRGSGTLQRQEAGRRAGVCTRRMGRGGGGEQKKPEGRGQGGPRIHPKQMGGEGGRRRATSRVKCREEEKCEGEQSMKGGRWCVHVTGPQTETWWTRSRPHPGTQKNGGREGGSPA